MDRKIVTFHPSVKLDFDPNIPEDSKDISVFSVVDHNILGLTPPTATTLIKATETLKLLMPYKGVEMYEIPATYPLTLFTWQAYSPTITRVWFNGHKTYLIYMVMGLLVALRRLDMFHYKPIMQEAITIVVTSPHLSSNDKAVSIIEVLIQSCTNGARSKFHLCLLHNLLIYMETRKWSGEIILSLSKPPHKNSFTVNLIIDGVQTSGHAHINSELDRDLVQAIMRLLLDLGIKYSHIHTGLQMGDTKPVLMSQIKHYIREK